MKIPFLRPTLPPRRLLPPRRRRDVRERAPRAAGRLRRGARVRLSGRLGRQLRVRHAALHAGGALGGRDARRGASPRAGSRAPRSSFPTPGRGSCRSTSTRCPTSEDAVREMVLWKLKKLLPGVTVAALGRRFARCRRRARASGSSWRRRRSRPLTSIEQAFESLGVRVGLLAPASLALFEGTARRRSPAGAEGDYALVHRTAGLVLAADRARRARRSSSGSGRPRRSRRTTSRSCGSRSPTTPRSCRGRDSRPCTFTTSSPGRSSRRRRRFPCGPIGALGATSSAPTRDSTSASARGRSCFPGFAAVWEAQRGMSSGWNFARRPFRDERPVLRGDRPRPRRSGSVFFAANVQLSTGNSRGRSTGRGAQIASLEQRRDARGQGGGRRAGRL